MSREVPQLEGEREDKRQDKQPAGGLPSSRMLRNGILISVALSVIALTIISLLTMDRRTFDALRSLRPAYLALAFLVGGTRPVWSAFRLRLLVKANGGQVGFLTALKIVYTGALTGAVTPLRAGGVSAEAYLLYRYALPGAQAVAVIALGACISVILLLLSVPLVLGLGAEVLHLGFTLRGVLYLASGIGILFVVAVIYSLHSPERALDQVLLRMAPGRLRRSRRYQRFSRGLGAQVDSFRNSIRMMVRMGAANIGLAFIYSICFWISGFIVIPIVLLGLGYPGLFVKALVGQMVVATILPFVPTPGSSGLGEAGFAAVFTKVAPSFLVGLLAVVWRFFDFYMSLILGGIALLAVLRDFRRGPVRETDEEPAAIDASCEPEAPGDAARKD